MLLARAREPSQFLPRGLGSGGRGVAGRQLTSHGVEFVAGAHVEVREAHGAQQSAFTAQIESMSACGDCSFS